jgi:hypothetical protein
MEMIRPYATAARLCEEAFARQDWPSTDFYETACQFWLRVRNIYAK